jgi:hypothetical protein
MKHLGGTKMSTSRVRKTSNRLLADLESHLKFLHEALVRLPGEPDRYKVLAAGLRVLVCDFGSNRPLLLDLLDAFDLKYSIGPIPDLPFPLPMVDELDLDSGTDFTAMSSEQIWAYHRSRAKSYPLREFVARGLAVFVLGRPYSYTDLIRTIAEQSGLSHEDPTVDSNILELESSVIGGYQGHVAPLLSLAEHVIAAGVIVINKAARSGYSPHFLEHTPSGSFVLPGGAARG